MAEIDFQPEAIDFQPEKIDFQPEPVKKPISPGLQAAYETAAAGFEPGPIESETRQKAGIPFSESQLPAITPFKGKTLPGQALAAVGNVGYDFARSLATPAGEALGLALPLAPPAVQGVAGIGFGVPLVKRGLQRVYRGAALADPQEVMEGGLETVGGGAMGAAGAKGILAKTPTPVEPTAAPVPRVDPPPPESVTPKVTEPPPETSAKGPGTIGKEEMGAAGREEIPETGAGGEKYGIAQRVREERAQAGQVEPVQPGQGINVPDSIERGRSINELSPDTPEKLLTKFEADKSLSSDLVASVRAHGEELARNARRIEERFGTESPEFDAARAALSVWDKRTKPVQTEWHKAGMAQQAWTDLDTGSVSGLEREFRAINDKDFTPEQTQEATRIAKGVRQAEGAEDQAHAAVIDRLDQRAIRDTTAADKAAFDAANKTVRENVVRIANLDKREQLAATESEKAAIATEKQAAQKAIDAANRTVREHAIRIAREGASVKERVRLDQEAKAQQAALDAANRTVRENAIRISELEKKQSLNRVEQAQLIADIEKEAADRAAKATTNQARAAAVRAAREEGKARIEQLKREAAANAVELKASQRALDAANKTVRENAIRIAKVEAEVNKRVQLNQQSKDEQAALDTANKTVREAAVRAAEAENKRRIARTAADKKNAAIHVAAEKRAIAAADKAVRYAARALAKTQRELIGNPIKAVWSKVRELIDKDRAWNNESDFNDIRTRVATELGMKVNAVTRIMARDKATARLMDDAWLKQQTARRLKQDARRWVAGADTPEIQKALTSAPRFMFGVTTFGHGLVPLGTHAPFVLFDPRYTGIYLKRYGTMYHMVAKKAFYEQQVQDLQRRPNYPIARKAGVINDPNVYEDYTNPKIIRFVTEGQIGVRGFFVLKILRQDMFDAQWNKLPKRLQTDEMAHAIGVGINHITGVTEAMAPKGLGSLLFAPRLEGSRVATIALDPAKAVWILTKSLWSKSTPAERHFATQQLISKSLIAGTLWTLLKVNQGVLSAIGSKQKVNTDDPMRSDFLKFKAAGMDFAYGNAMLSMMRMPLSVYRVVSSDGGKTKSLVYADESVYTVLGRFGRTQLSPFMGTLTDLGLGSDYASRPLPRAAFGLLPQNRPVPKRLAAEGLKPYSWAEYWSERGPIPSQEMIKEIWRYGFGMTDKQMEALEKALAITAIMGGTGGRLTEDIAPKK